MNILETCGKLLFECEMRIKNLLKENNINALYFTLGEITAINLILNKSELDKEDKAAFKCRTLMDRIGRILEKTTSNCIVKDWLEKAGWSYSTRFVLVRFYYHKGKCNKCEYHSNPMVYDLIPDDVLSMSIDKVEFDLSCMDEDIVYIVIKEGKGGETHD